PRLPRVDAGKDGVRAVQNRRVLLDVELEVVRIPPVGRKIDQIVFENQIDGCRVAVVCDRAGALGAKVQRWICGADRDSSDGQVCGRVESAAVRRREREAAELRVQAPDLY